MKSLFDDQLKNGSVESEQHFKLWPIYICLKKGFHQQNTLQYIRHFPQHNIIIQATTFQVDMT